MSETDDTTKSGFTIPEPEMIPLDSTIPDKLTGRKVYGLSPEATETWYPDLVIQLTERRKAISLKNARRIRDGLAPKRDAKLVAAERAERRAKAST